MDQTKPADLPINPEEWMQTPPSVRALVAILWREHHELTRIKNEMDQLRNEVGKLKEKAGKNSQNSSKPPSSDGPGAPPRPAAEGSGRKIGAQKGHTGHGRRHKPRSKVDRIVACKPDTCQACGALLLGEDQDPQCHQVSELPKVEPIITEYQLHTLKCLNCGAQTSGNWPKDMPQGSFGPRTQAMVGYLGGRFGLSDRDVEELMEVGFETEMSLGSVPAQEQAVSLALENSVQEAKDYVRQQPSANVDETSWHEKGERAWLWVGATEMVTIFVLIASRSAKGVQALLGDAFEGILGSDRWTAYSSFDPLRRQVCWAHLKRDFQALFERGGESGVVGKLLLRQTELLFSLWHRVRDGTLSRSDFSLLVQPIQTDVRNLLTIGTLVDHSTTRKTCANILDLEPALWTFVLHPGVEPTNNGAERPLRRGVIWRKRCFGTQSEQGSLFVGRILTAVMTLRQQNRNVLDFLTQACHARNGAFHAPSLLPTN